MKKIFLIVLTFIVLFLQILVANAEPSKVMSLDFDDSSSLIHIGMIDNNINSIKPIEYKILEAPTRLYFDIEDAILIGDKQQIIFEKTPIKEIRISQFSTEPQIVRCVVTFEDDFDISHAKIFRSTNNIIVKLLPENFSNDYFNPIYDEAPEQFKYSSIVANSQIVQKLDIPSQIQEIKYPTNVMEDIQYAFEKSSLNNDESKKLSSIVSVDVSSNLKLRTKYYINGYYIKNKGLLVSGLGQITAEKMFYLDSPKRVVIDLPNTFLDKKIRNTELSHCPDGSCKDTAKIGQFEFNKSRIVITSNDAEKYIPIYSADAQSLLFINTDKLNHTDLVSNIANLNKTYVKKINNKTSEIIMSFTAPVVHSILRDDKNLAMYFFNVQNYNEQELIKSVTNTAFNQLTFSLLPQIGIRATLNINPSDIIKIEQSIDGKAIKLIYKHNKEKFNNSEIIAKKEKNKNKIVIDPGHGGSDYGAIRDGINEKDITLDVSQRVAAVLKSRGYIVELTRNDDTYLSLEERVDLAEDAMPEIFISIHVNSAVAIEPNGIETHYYHEYSKDLASVIHSKLIKNINAKDRGLFKSKFYVINHTTMPAVLVEMGFISNPDERKQLITEFRKQKTAKAIAEGIIEYLKNAK